MSIVSGELAGLYNGVSQQAVAMRLPTQCELQDNFDATLVAGLKKRPPFEHVANMPFTAAGTTYMHIIQRDDTERYVLVIQDGQLAVYDFEGKAKTINAPSGFSYLSGGAGSYSAVTVADHTFIVNQKKQVRPSAQTHPARPYEALVNVAQGNYSRTYSITLNGEQAAQYLTPGGGLAGTANCASTENIAQLLIDGTLAGGGGVFYNNQAPNGTENRFIMGVSEDNYQISDNAGIIWKHMAARGVWSGSRTIEPKTHYNLEAYAAFPVILLQFFQKYQSFGGTLGYNKWVQAGFPRGPSDPKRTEGYVEVSPWTVQRYGSAIYLTNSQSDFSISVEDGYNGNAMKVAKTAVQRFTDLGNFAPVGYVVEISSGEGTALDSYWVQAEKDAGNDGNSQVIWKETAKPGCREGLDASTMPHLLVREADGSFTFKPAEWDARECGDDEDINPDPSFVGSTISDMFFHRNRLGFLSGENIVLSRSGDFFNFYRTTATAYLDDDPIDVAASHVKVSLMRHVVPAQDHLILFSDSSQFRLAGNELLTPRSVSLRPVSEFSSAPSVTPVAVGPSVFFVADSPANRDWAAVYEFSYDTNTETADASNVTAHVPSYIPSGVTQIVGSPDESCLAILSSGDPSALYVHRFYWTGNSKVQSAWMRFSTPSAAAILRVAFVKTDIYALVQRPGGICLERLRMSTSALDADHGYLIHLDRRITSDRLPAPVYSFDPDHTTYQLPFSPGDDVVAVSAGRMLEVESVGGSSVRLKGDTRGRFIYFGVPYRARYRFSTFFLRRASTDGGTVAQINGRLQLQHLALSFHHTGHFQVVVDPNGRTARTTDYHGRVLGDEDHVFGTVRPEGRRFSVPVMSRNDRVTIDLVNDSWLPSAFISATWRGQWNRNSLER
ncbi:hypothetical protein [Castellaniella sp.]|uniref:phage nozzle protein n=1 Tax=Castellaniella sp. TaxID=1955812 RepID=UPI002AFF6C51|nr:hypothetical protein [Castellaniella sp.]